MTRITATVAAAATVVLASLATQASGHMIQTYPYSRQYAHSSATDELPDGKDKPFHEGCPACYNSGGKGGAEKVMERGQRLTDPDVLKAHGGGDVYPLPWGKYADNGNYLESDEIAKRHGICGDPSSGNEDDFNRYGIASSNFDIYHEYKAGESFHIDILMWAWHSGHMEFFICNTDELPQGVDSVPTQECFNKIPLDRDPNHGKFSPIDPSYYGRYHLDPECTADETNIEVMNDWRGWIARMHYLIPDDLQCEHCVLQAVYRTGHQCRHPGYDDFNPPEPFSTSKCAPDKDAWVRSPTSGVCGDPGTAYAEEFWACTDIRVVGGGDGPAPAPTPNKTPAPDTEPETPGAVTREHLGCFKDSKEDRVLQYFVSEDTMMTTDYCCDYCAGEGDAFCATQYGVECWCSDEVQLVHDRHGDATCTYPCPGDETETEMCGGFDAFDLYVLTYP